MYLTDASPAATAPVNPTAPILEAIVRQRCLAATYNRADIVVAPHVLYTRHGELYVDAVTVSRNMVMVREPKLATFKLTGLGGLRVTERPFELSSLFDAELEKYDGVTLMKVEPIARSAG